jgi:hypothetical protein
MTQTSIFDELPTETPADTTPAARPNWSTMDPTQFTGKLKGSQSALFVVSETDACGTQDLFSLLKQ